MIADPKQGTTHTHFKTWITVSLRDCSSKGPGTLAMFPAMRPHDSRICLSHARIPFLRKC